MNSGRIMPVLLALAFMACARSAAGDDDVVAIVHAKAYTMAQAGLVEDATILIRNGTIAAIGNDIEVAADSRIIDAQGRPVTPGLITSSTQLGLVEVSSSLDTVDHADSESGLGASFDVQYALNPNSVLIPVARADGLTHGVVMPTASAQKPFNGLAAWINTGEDAAMLERTAIAMVAAISGPGSSEPGRSRSADWIALRRALDEAAELDSEVDSDAGQGRDDPAWPRDDKQALLPVIRGELPLVIRTERESDIRQAVAIRQDFGIRVIVMEANEAWRVASLLARYDVPVILDATANLPQRFDYVGSRLDNAAILHGSGVKLGFFAPGLHTSHNPGLEIREGAGLAVANGLPWDTALSAITAGAAEIWGEAEHAGRLEAGLPADLVVWSGDPFEMTTCALQVFVDGREVSLDNRQKQLRDRYLPEGLIDRQHAGPCASR